MKVIREMENIKKFDDDDVFGWFFNKNNKCWNIINTETNELFETNFDAEHSAIAETLDCEAKLHPEKF